MFKWIISSALIASSFVANAEFLKTSDTTFIDTETGIEWMDNGLTTHSIQEAVDRLSRGGDLYGWNFASLDQIQRLWNSYNHSYLYNALSKTTNGTSNYSAARYYDSASDSIGLVGVRNSVHYYDLESDVYLNSTYLSWWMVKSDDVTINSDSKYFTATENTNDVDINGFGGALLILLSFLFIGRNKAQEKLRK